METPERKRFIDINSLAEDQIADIEAQLGSKTREICDKACEEANKYLNVYGMQAQMQIVIQPIGTKKEIKKEKKRGKARKATNL